MKLHTTSEAGMLSYVSTLTTHTRLLHHSQSPQSPLTVTTHNDASIVIVLHEAVMEPHKLLVLPYRGEVGLLELLQCGLARTKEQTPHNRFRAFEIISDAENTDPAVSYSKYLQAPFLMIVSD